MSVEVQADCTYTDASHSIDLIVVEQDTSKSETITLIDGDNLYLATSLDGDPAYTYDVLIEASSQDQFSTPTLNSVYLNIPGSYAPTTQNQLTNEGDWDEIVYDSGESTRQLPGYTVTLTATDGTTRTFEPLDLSYSPSINSAQDASVKARPHEYLEGDDYLGSTIEIQTADGMVFYKGTVNKIDTDQPGEAYSLSTKSSGKKLKERTVGFTTDTDLSSDVMARIIDYYNDVDNDLLAMKGGSDETLSQITESFSGAFSVTSGNTSGTATYTDVGDSAIDVNQFYVRCYAPSASDSIDVEFDDGENTYTETITNSANKFGAWELIEPSGLADAYYDVTFTLNGDAILHNWRAISNGTIWRDITVTDATSDSQYENDIYTYSSGSGDGIPQAVDTTRVEEYSGGYQARQKCLWYVIDSASPGAESVNGNTVNGYAISTTGETYHDLDDLYNAGVSLPAWELWARVSLKTDNGAGEATYRITTNSLNEQIDGSIDTSGLDPGVYEWQKIASYSDNSDCHYDWQYTGDPSGPAKPRIKGLDPADDDVYFGEFVVIISSDADITYDYQFSDDLTNGQLSYPMLYDQGYVEFKPFSLPQNLIASQAHAVMTEGTNQQTDWGIIQTSNPDNWDFNSLPNSNLNSEIIEAAGTEHAMRVYLTGYGERDTATPRLGYQPQQVQSVHVHATYADVYVLYERDIFDNCLSALTSVADNSRYVFRFEGDTIVLFESGSVTTNTDIILDSAESSRSIQDTVKSVEVIGLGGITSGVIEAVDAPDFVTEHREIRKQNIKTKSDAVSDAKEYIRNHDEIVYSGKASTLPTFAPLGEAMPGSYFTHGQPMTIKSVDYGVNGASLSLGSTINFAKQLMELSSDTKNTKQRVTQS